MVSSGFKPQDDDIEEYVLQFVGYAIGILRLVHVPSSSI